MCEKVQKGRILVKYYPELLFLKKDYWYSTVLVHTINVEKRILKVTLFHGTMFQKQEKWVSQVASHNAKNID